MLKLMIVEDEPLESMALKKIISEEFEGRIECLEEAANGREAVIKARKLRPDVILMDIGLPELNGLDCQKKIREMLSDVRTIMISAYSDFYYMKRAVQENAVDYLLKPVRPSDLKKTVERIVVDMTKEAETPVEQSMEPSVIEKAMEYINQACCSKVSLNMVADEVHLNPQYLSRIFKKQMNTGVTEYINQKRIERAKELLVNTEFPLYRIARETGFGDSAHFSRVFYKIEQKRPSDYRKVYRR